MRACNDASDVSWVPSNAALVLGDGGKVRLARVVRGTGMDDGGVTRTSKIEVLWRRGASAKDVSIRCGRRFPHPLSTTPP